MKNIHLLPTDKPSRLWTNNLRRRLELDEFPEQHPTNIAKHIYITSNEKIKDGDWFINTSLNKPYQADASDVHVSLINEKKYCKKIILTTDQDLIKDGVQAIPDDFLEWFVKNPSCEEVQVNLIKDSEDHPEIEGGYREEWQYYEIIISKEEPKKVLTEEDIFNQKDIDTVTDYINKEQQKQHLIDMMKDDEELGLYGEVHSKQGIALTSDYIQNIGKEIKLEEVFNDEKKENIKKFIDKINNPSQPNDKLKQAFEKYSEYLEDYENKNTYEHGFKDGAKWQQEQYTIEEQHVGHTIDELDKEYIKGFNEGSAYYIERMYSEEDMAESFMACWKANVPEGFKCKLSFKEWFEQFKKQ